MVKNRHSEALGWIREQGAEESFNNFQTPRLFPHTSPVKRL